jgi:hypothetical protein
LGWEKPREGAWSLREETTKDSGWKLVRAVNILFYLFIFILLLWWVGVHCGIYKVLTIYQIYHT